jgi:ribonucleoside-diphosphate reductase alpha chain
VNLEYFDKWKKDKQFIDDLITMLDNVLEHFIEDIVDTSRLGGYTANFKRFKTYVKEGKEGMVKAAYSAYRERSVGLGAMGFHAYLQSKGLSFNGLQQTGINNTIFSHIKTQAVTATQRLAEIRGEAPDVHGSNNRNSHLLAVAPNASSSIICGGTSPSIEPYRANIYTHKTLSGNYKVKNKFLEKVLKKKGLNVEERDKVWKNISNERGSIQNIKIFNKDEKEIFKTADEINQLQLVEHAKIRQPYICQSQSVNLFFVPPKATEDQEVHNEYLQYVNDVHWYAMHNLKSLYYLRSDAAKSAENVNVKIPRINLEDTECLSCEG